MAVQAALLRGVNLGKRKVIMSELRELVADAGFTGVRTLLASGNLVLDSKVTGVKLEARLEAVILECLEKEPSRRPANVEALAAALASCLDTVTWTHADAQSWWERRRTRPASSRESSAPPGLTDQPTLAQTERPSRSASRPPS